MTYRTLLTYIGLPEQAQPVLETAARLQSNSSGPVHIIALHVIPQIPVYPDMAFMVSTELTDLQRNALVKQNDAVKAAVAESCEKLGLDVEWRSIEAEGQLVTDRILEHGRYADLVIGLQDDPDRQDDTQYGVMEQVMIEGGRPVLIVPYTGMGKTLGKNITVAWNGSREATRAVFDALPLLQQAESVTVLTVDKPAQGANDTLPGAELAATLARHNVRVTTQPLVLGDSPVPEVIVSAMADNGADLLVMGGYGHSRFREFVFGGVTHHLLQSMTTPVLMSH
ncbi:universal stress protein [Granulosicoccaceae sp. 1_MG-2023]|nr:universal stress protein [Granulosicoccaceae sp. 1_MG-2023]